MLDKFYWNWYNDMDLLGKSGKKMHEKEGNTMKKLIAMLLLACMLLTLASCGKKDESEKTRSFMGTSEGSDITYFATVQGNHFTLGGWRNETMATLSYTKNENGTYALEEVVEEYGVATLSPCGDGFYRITDFEIDGPDSYENMMRIVIKLDDKDTFTAYEAYIIDFTCEMAGDRAIIRTVDDWGNTVEIWGDSNTVKTFEVEQAAYTGDTKNFKIHADGETVDGSVNGDELTFSAENFSITMNRLYGDTFGVTQYGEEAIMRLNADHSVELLAEDERESGSITYVPGEKLELVMDGETVLSAIIDGKQLTMINEELAEGPVTLTEVK